MSFGISFILLFLWIWGRCSGCRHSVCRRRCSWGSCLWGSLLFVFFFAESFESLVDHFFGESLPAEEDAFLSVWDFLEVFAAEEDGGDGDEFLPLLQLLQVLLLFLLFLRLAVTHRLNNIYAIITPQLKIMKRIICEAIIFAHLLSLWGNQSYLRFLRQWVYFWAGRRVTRSWWVDSKIHFCLLFSAAFRCSNSLFLLFLSCRLPEDWWVSSYIGMPNQ